MRRFLLVRATSSSPGNGDVSHSGIKKLKRGVSLDEFISEYLSQFNLAEKEEYMRGPTKVVILRQESNILQWAFTEYSEDDLLHAVSHLTREELLRDLKELLPLKEIIR